MFLCNRSKFPNKKYINCAFCESDTPIKTRWPELRVLNAACAISIRDEHRFVADRGRTLDGNLVKVVVAGAHHGVRGATKIDEFSQKSMSILLTSAARRSGQSASLSYSFEGDDDDESWPVYLSKGSRVKERERERTRGERRKEREGEWQGESSCIDLSGEQTPIVHATDHSLKATSVTIASAGLESPRLLPVNERARIENRLIDRSRISRTRVECR